MVAVTGFFDDYFKNRELYKPTRKELERSKEETYYLVKFEYSDYEVNINGFALLNEKDKEFFDTIQPNEEGRFYLMDSVSASDEIEFLDYEKWKSCYTWEPISEEDRCTINVLIGSRCGYFFYPEVEE